MIKISPRRQPLLWALIALLVGGWLLTGLNVEATKTVATNVIRNEEVILLPDRIMPPPLLPNAVTLEKYEAATTIQDQVATTTITQVFKNTSSRTLEARYLFPLPEGAQFSSFTLTINGKPWEGKIMEKGEARRTYEEIVRKLIDPGLLEYLDDQTVQVSVAPFFAGETKTIRLSYTQLLSQDGGLNRYVYPLRLKEGSNAAPGQFKLSVDIKTTQALKTVYSPSHDPQISRQGNHQAKVSLMDAKADRSRDFILYFSQDNRDVTINSLNYRQAGQDGYFMLTVRMPQSVNQEKILPKDVVLVVDTSGSMQGEKMEQAKQALQEMLGRLRDQDRFSLIQFNTDVSAFNEQLTPASKANVAEALNYAKGLNASGSTNIEGALKAAFAQVANRDSKRPAYVVFLTDGEPTIGVTDTAGLVKIAQEANRGQARLFNFGVGYNLSTRLLNELAEDNHGTVTYVEPEENLELAMTRFFQKIDSPVLTNAKLDFGNLRVDRLYPAALGDLFAGNEVIVLGRYTGNGTGNVTLSGQVGNQTRQFSTPINWPDSTRHNQLPRLWAGRRIAWLLEEIRKNGENAELKDEIIALSKQHGIITPYTSFIALEDKTSHRPGSPIPMHRGSQQGASAIPMASMDNMNATGGSGAVRFEKALGKLKTQTSVQELDETGTQAQLRTVHGKTFQHTPEGHWVDTTYDEKSHGKPKMVTFGSSEYFQLLRDKPALIPYFSMGEAVLVVLDGTAYQVVMPKGN